MIVYLYPVKMVEDGSVAGISVSRTGDKGLSVLKFLELVLF